MKESSRNLISVDATKTRYGGTGHKFYCRYDGGRIVMAERKKDHSVGVKRVMDAVQESELPMSRKDILEATKLGTTQLQQALEDAVAANLLVRGKVNKADVYSLVEEEEGNEN